MKGTGSENTRKYLMTMAIISFPIYFILMLPIEYPLWREYKKQKYNVPNYFKFFWYRCVILKDQNYHKP